MRYSSYTASGSFTYKDSTYYPAFVQDKPASGSFTYTGIGGGLMLGYQWVISNKVSIDWWILGIHGGTSAVHMRVDAAGIGESSEDVRKQLDDIDIPGATKTSSVSGNTAKLDITGLPFFGVRTGFCIGIAF